MARKDISDEMIVKALYQLTNPIRHCGREPFDETIARISSQPEKVVWRALERAASREYITYGTTLRFPFLTRKGFELAGKVEQ